MERLMKKSGEKSERIQVFLKTLVVAWGSTIVALFGLAFLLHRFQIGESEVSIGIIVTYVLTTFLCGRYIGKKLGTRKFLWGMVSGLLYFIILVVLSFLVHPSEMELGNQMWTIMVLCVASGTLGGMLA